LTGSTDSETGTSARALDAGVPYSTPQKVFVAVFGRSVDNWGWKIISTGFGGDIITVRHGVVNGDAVM
jgi:hypothetical protein